LCRAVSCSGRRDPAVSYQEDTVPMLAEFVDGVIGVDTHRDTLAAAALSSVGGVLAQTAVPADAAGYQALLGFADAYLPGRRCWAIEGAGSYGAAWRPCSAVRVSRWWRPADPSGRRGAAAPRPMPSMRSAPPATRLVSRPSSCLRSASGVTTRHDGCC
jgi:hypothetical protein